MFENILHIFKKNKKIQGETLNKEQAKERLQLLLMQDRASVSADFLDMMRQEIIDVIKKYIDVDENQIEVKLTNKPNADGTTGAPALLANIPIVKIKKETRINSNIKKLNEISDKTVEKKGEKNKPIKAENNNAEKSKVDNAEQSKVKDNTESSNEDKTEVKNNNNKENNTKKNKKGNNQNRKNEMANKKAALAKTKNNNAQKVKEKAQDNSKILQTQNDVKTVVDNKEQKKKIENTNTNEE